MSDHEQDLGERGTSEREAGAPIPEVANEEAAAAPESAVEPNPDADVDLPTAIAQRDEYLSLARRVQADFENFRKRTIKQQQDQATHASARLVESLLPVLDAFDNAVIHGVEGIGAIHKQLLDVLGKAGLEIVPTEGVPFDPNQHEAVLHEPGDTEHPEIVECLRTGYKLGGRVLRAAMVKVKG